MRTPVIIESPYAGDVEANMEYLQLCILDSIARGEAPMASHQMYTRALKDAEPAQRALGIICGFVWLTKAEMQVFYIDRGWSPGMRAAQIEGRRLGVPQKYREIG